MDIYIDIDKQDMDKFKTVASNVSDKIKELSLGQIKSLKDFKAVDKSLCLVFSNRLQYVEKIASKIKCEVINVTNNLSSGYILAVLKSVKDIYYSKADIDVLLKRLSTRINYIKHS